MAGQAVRIDRHMVGFSRHPGRSEPDPESAHGATLALLAAEVARLYDLTRDLAEE